MSHQMTTLDAKHALYRETPWHQLGNIGSINWETARDAFDWCEVERTPILIHHIGDRSELDGNRHAWNTFQLTGEMFYRW